MPEPRVVFMTYFGVDGACAAAAGLLRHPSAEVEVTSANRVGETLAALGEDPLAELHVCGLGVACPWDEVERPARRVRECGGQMFWYCGRGYLEGDRARFAQFCEPVFIDAGTNTAAVAKALGVTEHARAPFLAGLASFDPFVGGHRPEQEMGREHALWADLLHASISHYFKYQDSRPYPQAVHKLARGEFGRHEAAAVDLFRRTGYRYMLHGRSEATRALRRRIQKCADTDRPVIITGESGTGKEHVAQLLRERSGRRAGPFVAVNCALFSGNTSLANADLFGHLKGAFTGASSSRAGKFVEADSGILYLDELGDLPLDVQAKLLRVLEDGQVTPVGADVPGAQVDVRVIAATNHNLPARIREGAFRADLYHRLATLRVHVPPLRERAEDIAIIVEQRLALLAEEGYRRAFTQSDYDTLRGYDWPGNVRQLIKVVERAVLLDESVADALDEEAALGETAPRDRDPFLPDRPAAIRTMDEVRGEYARRAWELCGRNYSAAARALGVHPNTLRYNYLSDNP